MKYNIFFIVKKMREKKKGMRVEENNGYEGSLRTQQNFTTFSYFHNTLILICGNHSETQNIYTTPTI